MWISPSSSEEANDLLSSMKVGEVFSVKTRAKSSWDYETGYSPRRRHFTRRLLQVRYIAGGTVKAGIFDQVRLDEDGTISKTNRTVILSPSQIVQAGTLEDWITSENARIVNHRTGVAQRAHLRAQKRVGYR
jgi:hypothetical protein